MHGPQSTIKIDEPSSLDLPPLAATQFMTAGPRLSPAVLSARETLAAGREKLRRQHEAGSPGVQVCTLWTDLLEGVVGELFRDALMELGSGRESIEPGLAVVAHSGFGRREMAPYSDLDVMLLHAPAVRERASPAVRRFSQHLYDTGMEIGFAARTPDEACKLAASDATIFTSLIEARRIAGSSDLCEAFDRKFRRLAKRHWKRLLAATEQARREERGKYGETVFMLEPNLKRSRGGLRDLQLVRWIGFLRYGQCEFDALAQAGALTGEEQRQLRDARDFLLWLRNDLHFHSQAASDVLERTEQLRIAEIRKYDEVPGLLPVEQFMRQYFQHTSRVREIAAHLADGARPLSWSRLLVEPLLSHRYEGELRVGPTTISMNRRGLARLQGDLTEVFSLLDLSARTDKRIDDVTWQAIRKAMQERGPADVNLPLLPTVAAAFWSLLGQTARLGESLRKLHELRVLEQLVPAMTHARGLLQFNAYHRYTVDEHSIRVVEHLTSLNSDQGRPGEVYRSIRNKALLHLTALLHDLGKGYPQDHSEYGAVLAEQTAARLCLSEHDTETLRLLVLKHLRMSHLAQQHDITDDKVVVQFAFEVGSPEVLKMLYVLTLADLAAVGPGVLNQWKQQLLTDLYDHTLHLLATDSSADAASQRLMARRQEVLALVRRHEGQAWWETQVLALPTSWLFAVPPTQIALELDQLRKLPHHEAVAWGRHVPARNVVEYTIGTYEEIAPGIFHRLTGALTSLRHQILSADINTLPQGLVLDRFCVQDQDFSGLPPQARIDEVCRALVAALKDDSGRSPTFRKVWQQKNQTPHAAIQHLPTRITTDNDTASRFTIIAAFAYDRMGLLYAIARALFELGLSVSKAKIGTHLDQVVDVFYVTDQATGQKITDEGRLHEIREKLLAAIEAVEAA